MIFPKPNLRSARGLIGLFAGLALSGAFLSATPSAAQNPDSFTETHGSWKVTCARPEGQPLSCQVFEEFADQRTRQRILRISFTLSDQGDAQMTLLTPFWMSFEAGVNMEVDGTQWGQGDYQTCRPAGCFVVVDMSESQLSALEAGSEFSVRMTNINEQSQTLNLPLTGFGRAFTRLEEIASES